MAFGDLLPFRRTSSDTRLFPEGVRESDATRDRVKAALELKNKLLDRDHTTEIYGPAIEEWDLKPDKLMENPDELSSRWGFTDIDKICNDMASNVLPYGGWVEGRLDMGLSLQTTWIVGVKGDPESERARDEVEAAYEAIPERYTVERELCRAAERGFMGAENIFDVQTVGAAKGLVTIVEMRNRPQSYFGFDVFHRPYLKSHGRNKDPQRIDDYKVTFARQGSLHTRYGAGFAQRCYPYVFAIDSMQKQHMAAIERASWIPVIVLHPQNWTREKQFEEYTKLRRQWKNVMLIPAEVDAVRVSPMTEGAYSHANASGASRMEMIKHMEFGLAMMVRGSQPTSGTQQSGSFAREQTVDEAQLWKAPADAAAREAMWNRGLVEPTMLANHPTMERAKWPRCSIESSFGEDLRLFMELCEQGVRNGVPISTVTWSERAGIPLAQEGDPVLMAAQSPAPLLPDGMAADEVQDPVTGIVQRMSEPASLLVRLADGRSTWCRPSQPVLTDKGIVMAKYLTGGGHVKLLRAGA